VLQQLFNGQVLTVLAVWTPGNNVLSQIEKGMTFQYVNENYKQPWGLVYRIFNRKHDI